MAYFDNQDLWYELFQAGLNGEPLWWSEIVKSKARFNYAMSLLHDYSLVEIQAGNYSLHTCVHDWTMGFLNRIIDDNLCYLAIRCIGLSVRYKTEAEYWVGNRRLMQHIQRLDYNRIKASIDWSNIEITDLCHIAYLCKQIDMNAEAEAMYLRALQGFEKAWGAEHTSTLDTVNKLGTLYADQGKMAEAEAMYLRALQGYENVMGADHPRTRVIARNLNALRTPS